MSNKERSERNEAIALFLGWRHVTEPEGLSTLETPCWYRGDSIYLKFLNFNRDFNDLMRAVKKISELEKYPQELKHGDYLLSRFDYRIKDMYLAVYRVEEDNWSKKRFTYSADVNQADCGDTLDVWFQVISDFCIDYNHSRKCLQS